MESWENRNSAADVVGGTGRDLEVEVDGAIEVIRFRTVAGSAKTRPIRLRSTCFVPRGV